MPHSSGPPRRFNMALPAMYVTYSSLVCERLLGTKHRHYSGPALPWHSTLIACLCIHFWYRMTRPRGRPKRGSPWRPRRPPVYASWFTFAPSFPSSSSSTSHCSPACFDRRLLGHYLWLANPPFAPPSRPSSVVQSHCTTPRPKRRYFSSERACTS
jgi:hypothetical protein